MALGSVKLLHFSCHFSISLLFFFEDVTQTEFLSYHFELLSSRVMDVACLSVHGDSPGKNTGVGCRALLQGILPTQGLNPGLLHCRQIFYCLNHQGKLLGIYFINIYFHFSHPILLPCNKFSIIYGFQS